MFSVQSLDYVTISWNVTICELHDIKGTYTTRWPLHWAAESVDRKQLQLAQADVGWVLLYVHRNRRFIRDWSPGRPPGLSHSSWALVELTLWQTGKYHGEAVRKRCVQSWALTNDKHEKHIFSGIEFQTAACCLPTVKGSCTSILQVDTWNSQKFLRGRTKRSDEDRQQER